MDTKKCTKCKKVKPLSAFSKHASCKGGRHSQCKECRSAHVKAKYAGNGDAKQAATNRQRRFAYLLRHNWNMTIDDYMRMFDAQNGVCAICGQPELTKHNNGQVRRLAVDHDHTTGAIRGLLCNNCNNMLGRCRRNQPATRRYSLPGET